jgi:hypothetical protein
MKWLLTIIVVLQTYGALGQGSFQNLDFESANLTPIASGQPGVEVPITLALPGWSAELGNSPVTQVWQNDFSLGAPSIDILGPNWNSPPQIIDGYYSVVLQAGLAGGVTPETASLWQNGTIPAGTESLEFKAWDSGGITPPLVSFAGDNLSLFVLSSGVSPSGQTYNVYGANIAPYADQTGQLEFTAAVGNVAGVGGIEMDDITFSTTAVPEPNSIVLTGIGGLIFAWYRRRLRCR